MSEIDNNLGIKKISITDEQSALNLLAENLPADAAALLASMQQFSKDPAAQDALLMLSKMQNMTAPIDKVSISNTSPGLNSDVQNEIKNYQSTEMVRAVPQEVQKAMEIQQLVDKVKTTKDNKEKYTIYEQGIAFGIIVNKTTKSEVNIIMKEISKINYADDDNELIAFYNDIYVTVLYNDEMIVREIQFGNKYRGETTKGLRAGDHIDKAIELYGQPKMKSVRGALWNKFGVFCENNFITSIRLMS